MDLKNIVLSRIPRIVCLSIIVGLSLSCTVKNTRRSLSAPDPIKIQDIRVAEGTDKTIIELESEEPILYTSFRLSDPDRLVIEMADVTFGQYQDEIKISEGPVRSIMLASSGELDVSRLEFKLNGLVKTDVRPEGLNIVIEVTRIEQASGPGKANQVESNHKKSFIFFGDKENQAPNELEPNPGIETIREEPLDADIPSIDMPLNPPALAPAIPEMALPTVAEIPPSPTDVKKEAPVTDQKMEKMPLPLVDKKKIKKEVVMTSPAQFVSGVKFIEGDSLQLVITSDGRLSPNIFFVGEKKERLVIDFPGVRTTIKEETHPGDGLFVRRVRFGRHPKKLRLVLDLNLPVTYSWEQRKNELWVTLK